MRCRTRYLWVASSQLMLINRWDAEKFTYLQTRERKWPLQKTTLWLVTCVAFESSDLQMCSTFKQDEKVNSKNSSKWLQDGPEHAKELKIGLITPYIGWFLTEHEKVSAHVCLDAIYHILISKIRDMWACQFNNIRRPAQGKRNGILMLLHLADGRILETRFASHRPRKGPDSEMLPGFSIDSVSICMHPISQCRGVSLHLLIGPCKKVMSATIVNMTEMFKHLMFAS